MPAHPASALGLRAGDRERLSAWVRSSSVRAGLAQRARIVLLAADGVSNTEIAERVGVSRPTVIAWRARYERSGIGGLPDMDRPGRPRTIDHDKIIAATLKPPPKSLGVTHWSSLLLAAMLKIDNTTVARAWRSYGVQPWRAQTFKFSTDPELVAKVTDVVGLYRPHRRTRWCCAWMRSPRSRRWTAPRRCCPSSPDCRTIGVVSLTFTRWPLHVITHVSGDLDLHHPLGRHPVPLVLRLFT